MYFESRPPNPSSLGSRKSIFTEHQQQEQHNQQEEHHQQEAAPKQRSSAVE